MKFTLTAVVKQVLPTETTTTKSGEAFSKTLVIFDDTATFQGRTFENLIPITFSGKHNDLGAKMKVGQKYTVDFTIRGREYNGKFYANNEGYSAVNLDEQVASMALPGVQTTAPQAPAVTPTAMPDDLPF